MNNKQKGIVGKYFHSYINGVIHWQGYVLSKQGIVPALISLYGPEKDFYLVQLFEWLLGEPSDQVLINFSEMKEWKFYNTREELLSAYERYRNTNGAILK